MKNLLIQYSTLASRCTEPFAWQAAGMGYMIRSESGKWIVVDGGHDGDAEEIVKLLEEHSQGIPEIDIWFITHPHGDHTGALKAFSENPSLMRRAHVNRVCSCMPDESFIDKGRGTAYRSAIRAVYDATQRIGAETCHVRRGEIYHTDDVMTEILLTTEDLLSEPTDPNETSLIFRVTAGGNRILFLGDTYEKPAKQLATEYGYALQSDFCQLAHHALNGGHTDLYRLTRSRIALVPMSRPAFYEMTEGKYRDSHATAHNRYVLTSIPEEDLWISADGTRIVELPYSGF